MREHKDHLSQVVESDGLRRDKLSDFISFATRGGIQIHLIANEEIEAQMLLDQFRDGTLQGRQRATILACCGSKGMSTSTLPLPIIQLIFGRTLLHQLTYLRLGNV